MHPVRFRNIFAITALLLPALPAAGQDAGCLSCHGDGARMATLGYPHFTVTREEVARQSGMSAGCPDCHLGDGSATIKEQAHTGMGRLLLVRKKGLSAAPAERHLPLEVTGSPMVRIKALAERDGKQVVDPSVGMVLYQDKRTDTLSQDFGMMERTCGRCHRQEFDEFTRSTMGRNAKQRTYRTWNDAARGPHNCGAWFGDNQPAIAANTRVPFSPENAALNQRVCNTCHVGCLDCHYDPQSADPANPRQGMHSFHRTPPPESCYGGGRGQICHAGPEERRRGAGYFGGVYANPEGAEPDVHQKNRVGCLDCHASSRSDKKLGHAMIKRQARCDQCHDRAVKSHARSVHRRLSCEACHIQNVGGYQGTFWGPGIVAGSPTPFFKYKEYYGVMAEPILIRDQRGRWIPVKPYPMAVLNQEKGPDLAPGLHWRWPRGLPDLQRTDDAWGYVGIVAGLPENNRALLWIQMDKLSHKYGTSRSCASCHELPKGEQRQHVDWDYTDVGAEPFSGSHTVLATRTGLFIRDLRAKDSVEPQAGFSISSFAPWLFLADRWSIPGDFSLPPLKQKKRYRLASGNLDKARAINIIHR